MNLSKILIIVAIALAISELAAPSSRDDDTRLHDACVGGITLMAGCP